MWVYLEGSYEKAPTEVEVNNTILTEVYEDQANLAHVKVRQATKTMHFNRVETTKKLYFKH